MVGITGLEPAQLSSIDFKSIASANSAISPFFYYPLNTVVEVTEDEQIAGYVEVKSCRKLLNRKGRDWINEFILSS